MTRIGEGGDAAAFPYLVRCREDSCVKNAYASPLQRISFANAGDRALIGRNRRRQKLPPADYNLIRVPAIRLCRSIALLT